MKTYVLRAGIVAGLATIAAASPAMANSSSAQFEVRLEIQAACSVTAGAGSDIDLGAHASTATDLSGSSEITVNCSPNTPYFIGLMPSNADDNGAGIMEAAAGSSDEVPYQLRSTAGSGGTIWGNTATSSSVGNGVSGVGIGDDQTIPVYVTVDSANFTPASYSDVVTVAVNF